MKFMLHECGFEMDKSETPSWGSHWCLIANRRECPTYNRFLCYSLKNDPHYPVVERAYAQK